LLLVAKVLSGVLDPGISTAPGHPPSGHSSPFYATNPPSRQKYLFEAFDVFELQTTSIAGNDGKIRTCLIPFRPRWIHNSHPGLDIARTMGDEAIGDFCRFV
jgi:hypothetical protein